MSKTVFGLVLILFSGCSSIQLKNEIPMSDPIDYSYSINEWLVSDSELVNNGLKKDSVIWIDRALQENFRITFDVSITNTLTTDLFELIFIIYGDSKNIGNNFWKDGYVVSYKNDKSKSTSVRINGIYDGTEWLINKNINNPITQNDVMHVDISVINNYLTFLINDQKMFVKLPLKKINRNEYFGIAQYWESANKKIKIQNIKFYK